MNAGYVVGVDLGGTKILTALADAGGNILARVRVPTPDAGGVTAVLDRLAETVREVSRGLSPAALGVGCPGPLDHVTGTVYQAPNLGWRDVPLAFLLKERLGVPVFVENDANLAALGEYTRGAGRGVGHLVYVTVSTGIGAGLILDGRIYQGEGGGAGEIGHMTLEPDGPPCRCGRRGCLEALASGTAIARRARELGLGNEDVTAAAVSRLAQEGDAVGMDILREAAAYLGWGLANVVTLLAPRRVVLGGGVTAAPGFVENVRAETARRTYGPAWERVDVVPALLAGESGLYGAVALALGGAGGAVRQG